MKPIRLLGQTHSLALFFFDTIVYDIGFAVPVECRNNHDKLLNIRYNIVVSQELYQ